MTTKANDRTLSELVEERDHLIASIADLEREHAAGEVSDDDYRSLRADYVSRAASTLRQLEHRPEDESDVSTLQVRRFSIRTFRRLLGRRRSRRILAVVAICCGLAALAIAAASFAGVRLPGETPSGSISLPTATQVRNELTDAQLYVNSGNLSDALTLYNTVLSQVPDQPEALAYGGWLERLAGIAKGSAVTIRAGDTSIAKSIQVSPDYADAKAFEVIVLLEDNHATSQANEEFNELVRTRPSSALLSAIGPQMALAFRNANLPVPTSLRLYESKKAK